MTDWTHMDFVCAAYSVTAVVLLALVGFTWRDWQKVRRHG